MNILLEETAGRMLLRTIYRLYKQHGYAVILINEYDKPILDNLSDEYLHFVLITGISKFSKMGVFSAMNNLEDISYAEGIYIAPSVIQELAGTYDSVQG